MAKVESNELEPAAGDFIARALGCGSFGAMNTKTVIVASLALAAGAWWVLGGDSEEASSSDGAVSVLDQVWIDQVPLKERDKVNVFAMLSDAKIGLYNQSSAYEGEFSLFEFKHKQGKIAVTMLQNGESHKLSYKITKKGCGPAFDYCLKVKGAPRGPATYGTMKDWVIDGKQLDAKSLDSQVRDTVFGGAQ